MEPRIAVRCHIDNSTRGQDHPRERKTVDTSRMPAIAASLRPIGRPARRLANAVSLLEQQSLAAQRTFAGLDGPFVWNTALVRKYASRVIRATCDNVTTRMPRKPNRNVRELLQNADGLRRWHRFHSAEVAPAPYTERLYSLASQAFLRQNPLHAPALAEISGGMRRSRSIATTEAHHLDCTRGKL
jgi:hypothetical protein